MVEPQRRSVLLLGEGDFTFTRALREHLPDIDVVATSFDSRSELVEKYRDVRSLLQKWTREQEEGKSIQILHGIDATCDLRSQLRESGGDVANQVFDTVVFNFPHLGVEDARLHGLMIAHVMNRVMHLFSTNSGDISTREDCRFVLALADAQSLRWHTQEMGERNRLPQVGSFPFRPMEWPGYEVRRHINGKSFKTRVDLCSFLVHSTNSTIGLDCNPFVALLRRFQFDPPRALSADHLVTSKDSAYTHTEQKLSLPANKNSGKKKKRKMVTLTEGHWIARAPTEQECLTTGATSSSAIYACSICSPGSKVFHSEGSVVAHVYNVHILGASSASSSSSTAGQPQGAVGPAAASQDIHECNICGKQLRGEQALNMHMHAAHGEYEVLKPDWAASHARVSDTTEVAASTTGSHNQCLPNPLFAAMSAGDLEEYKWECKICGTFFRDEASLSLHLQAGFQPQPETQNAVQSCPHCSRQFKDQRALYQHMNLCKAL